MMRRRISEMRLACLNEISINEKKIDSACEHLIRSLPSLKKNAESIGQRQAEYAKLREQLKELEDQLARITAAKADKRKKSEDLSLSSSAAKSRCEELKGIVSNLKSRKEELEANLSHRSLALEALEERSIEQVEYKKGQEEVISWYNRVFGLRIEAGHGIKFIFKNIDPSCLDKEFSFTIRHSEDTYTLLDCHPCVQESERMIHDLNRTNGLFMFVRMMRQKFKEAALSGFSNSAVTAISTYQQRSNETLDHPSNNELVISQQANDVGKTPDNRKISKFRSNLSYAASPVRRSPRLQVLMNEKQ